MNEIERLAADFRRWGKDAVERIQAGATKWGTQFNSYVNGDDC